MSTTEKSFTGRRRQRSTRRSVVIADRTARSLISIGGIGTIVAVLGVFLFLVWVVLPLFLPADVSEASSFPLTQEDQESEPLHLGVDEYQLLAWTLWPSGKLDVFRLDNGELRAEQQLFAAEELASASFLLNGDLAVFGLRDGTLRLAEIGFATRIIDPSDVPAELAGNIVGQGEELRLDYEDGVLQPTAQGPLRIQRLQVELGEEARIGEGPVRLLHHVIGPNGPLIVALVDDAERGPRLQLVAGENTADFLTGRTKIELQAPIELPYEAFGSGPPVKLALAGSGSTLYVAWADGSLLRINCQDKEQAFIAERLKIVPPGEQLTAIDFVLGNNTLVWGDSAGKAAAGFPVYLSDYHGQGLPGIERQSRADEASSIFLETKELASTGAAVRAFAASSRSRLLLIGFADGTIRFSNVTNAATLATIEGPSTEPITRLVMSPKEDGFVALTPTGIFHAKLDPGYPEVSFSALFRPVWYEGYSEPQHVWQSSSGTDDFEMKLGLMPLIFGTIKATLYSMLFGAPLALLAAVFSSEFLNPRSKAVIKPSIELMASLPSVVLGFLAALVFAPFVDKIIPAVLTGFLTLPLTFMLGAYVWQLLPSELTLRLGTHRFLFIAMVLPIGVAAAVFFGPVVERWLFAGDIKAWLAWDAVTAGADQEAFRNATGGFMLLFTPLSALLIAILSGRFANPWMRARSGAWSRQQFALVDLARFCVGLLMMLTIAWGLSALFSSLGLDPRGSYVDTYVQRNALIVGFVMGFAVIPIIYTISEDALSTVPEHLRSASLGAGATPWQTAVRIVIPTAMSGLFSALMVGLGRAVGETMIVLMAAGNTPVMSWNLFEGFRTLSANIAVELPEAVRNSAHYRTLFLAALTLFAMTFVVNTVAEIIRLRFRKRAYQL